MTDENVWLVRHILVTGLSRHSWLCMWILSVAHIMSFQDIPNGADSMNLVISGKIKPIKDILFGHYAKFERDH